MNANLNRSLLCAVLVLSAAVSAQTRIVELTLHPAAITESARKYALLPRADRLTDADALPLYEKAIQLMPKDVDQKQIREWLELPVGQFPRQEADQVVQRHVESLRLVVQATRCADCNWPEFTPNMKIPDLTKYRELAFVTSLWARLEISRGQYKGASAAIQTELAMARHLGQAPTTVQVLVGAAIAGLAAKELDQWVQGSNSPNLHPALQTLPEPLIDMEKAAENERANLKKHTSLIRRQFEKPPKQAFDRIRTVGMRLDNHVNALQALEAIRHYAAMHDGQLPRALGDITGTDVPNDLNSGKAFEYRRTATGATLRSAVPEGGKDRDAVHYQIVLRK